MQTEPVSTLEAEISLEDVRAAINAIYAKWGRGRVEYDRSTLDSILTTDFYVLLDGKRLLRAEFLDLVLRKAPDRSLTRFDVDVLTIQRTEDGWTAVIGEKIEVSSSGADGRTERRSSYWVTRDGFRLDGDKWLISFSEAIGYENWADGVEPPVVGW